MEMEMSSDEAKAVAGILSHQQCVRSSLGELASELVRRGYVHDRSKLSEDELPGYVLLYGGEKNAQTRDAINRHYSCNSHHPEHYADASRDMTWLDIVEMVCDWKAASESYAGTVSLRDWATSARDRFKLSDHQWWLVDQVVASLDPVED
jgi:hypothetical protein